MLRHVLAVALLVAAFVETGLLYEALGLVGLLVGQASIAAIVLWFYGVRAPRGARETLGLGLGPVPAWLSAVLLAGGLVVVVPAYLGFQEGLFPMPEEMLSWYEGLMEAVNAQPLMAVVALALAPALCEELIFRGLLLRALLRQLGRGGAIVVSSLAFALVHIDPWRLVATLLLGALLGHLAVAADSVLPGMLLHMLYNASLILGGEALMEAAGERNLLWAALLLIVMGLAVLTRVSPPKVQAEPYS